MTSGINIGGIVYEEYSPLTPGSEKRTAQLIECYRGVFATPPWNEYVKCTTCDKQWGSEDYVQLAQSEFKCCEQELVDVWPRAQVLSDIKRAITTDAICILAIDNDRVVGFTWGYAIAKDKLDEKLGLATDLRRVGCNDNNPTVFYQDEIGVLKEYRGRRIASTLSMLRSQFGAQRGLGIEVARVKAGEQPSLTYLWYRQKLAFEQVAAYPQRDDRVVLARCQAIIAPSQR